MLKQLYPNIRENDVIVAYKYGRYAKVDMVIRVNNEEKGISIKSGFKNSVHLEPIDKFILYLTNTKQESTGVHASNLFIQINPHIYITFKLTTTWIQKKNLV